jgi:hypothetical protein
MLTKQEAIEKYGRNKVRSFKNGDWAYSDDENWEHLMRKINGKWIELTEGIKTWEVYSYENGDWEYKDENGWWHDVKFDASQYKEKPDECRA